MQYYRLDETADGLVANTDDGVFDLGTAETPIESFRALAATAARSNASVDEIAETAMETADEISESALSNATLPLHADEVWAAGVTYEISEQAREEESSEPDIYDHVYDADRPEIFFKATPSRTVGPDEAVGIREDSTWDVPEPELGVVLYRGEPVGYTIGNDMSSRSIEGENPLYLPQAKVYDRCCSIGPSVASADVIEDPHDLEMRMSIERDGGTQFEGSTSTGQMKRSCEELTSYLNRHNAVPELAVLLTGTSLVPGDDFTLQEDDTVSIEIDGIGRLENGVTIV
ncbi:fumarylacetoacetate hydrolase family protein [Halopenitus sp. H-Gu1]|uniref:fumarylacetoacetate hydrolase family protein n=1 Tax=Halopenitus sp. H-Gu1 TaxID=3242697 RepID=UPI00359EFDD6